MAVRKTDYLVSHSSCVLKHPDVHVHTTKKIVVKQNHLFPPLKSPNLLHHWQLWNTSSVLRRRISFVGSGFGLELQLPTKGWQSSKRLRKGVRKIFHSMRLKPDLSLSHTQKKQTPNQQHKIQQHHSHKNPQVFWALKHWNKLQLIRDTLSRLMLSTNRFPDQRIVAYEFQLVLFVSSVIRSTHS